MHTLLLDTCVWLETATSSEGGFLLSALERLVESKTVMLLVPEVVQQEFGRHKGSIAKRQAEGMRSRLRDAKSIIGLISASPQKEMVLAEVETVRSAIQREQERWSVEVTRIERLLAHPTTVRLDTTDDALLNAAQRGVEKKAPFHSGKNSTADAVILELFVAYAVEHTDAREKSIFATSNTNDFAAREDRRRPHPDLAHLFTSANAYFANNLGEALNLIQHGTVPSRVIDNVIHERDAYPRCTACYEGFLLPWGYKRLPEGLVWHWQCENCGTQFSPRVSGGADDSR